MATASANSPLEPLLEKKITLAHLPRIKRALRDPIGLLRRRMTELAAARGAQSYRIRLRTFWGQSMYGLLPDKQSTQLLRYGYHEPDLSWAILRLLQPGGTFIDVGAHIGYFTLLAARIVGPMGQVHAFEPTRAIFPLLEENTGSFKNSTVNNMAVYSRDGECEFHDYGIEFSMFNSLYSPRLEAVDATRVRTSVYSVKVVRLDSYVEELGIRPDFIKVDAENAESDILAGMDMILSQKRPIISLEMGDIAKEEAPSSRDCVRYLESKGYVPMEIAERRLTTHEKREVYDYLNLLFLPVELREA